MVVNGARRGCGPPRFPPHPFFFGGGGCVGSLWWGGGGEVSWGDDADVGIGVRYENPLSMFGPTVRNLRVIGSFDYFFPGDQGGTSVTYFEVNANVAWAFSLPRTRISPYAGRRDR